MNELKEQELRQALHQYSIELVPAVLDVLEVAGQSDKICNMIKQLIYDKRDIVLTKIRLGKL